VRKLFFLLIALCVSGCGGNNTNSTPQTISRAWGTAVLIETNNAGSAANPQLSFDASGNAFAVWEQYDGTRFNIWANRYTAATGTWGAAALIETDNAGQAYSPQVVIDSSGNATAVWHQSDGTRYHIWTNRYKVSTGTWGVAVKIETDNSGDAEYAEVAVDASGNVVAVWQQSQGSAREIWSNRYTAASGTWGIAVQIEGLSNSNSPKVAIDASGNAVAVWSRFNSSYFNIWSNRYIASTGTWGTAQLIETDTMGNSVSPQVTIDVSGNVIAVWSKSAANPNDIWSDRYTICSNRYKAATNTWGTSERIDSDNTGSATGPQVAIDASGNAVVVWYQYDGTRYNIWSNRYNAATKTWGTAIIIEADNSGSAYLPQVATDASGNALVVWYLFNGTSYSLWANRYNAATSTWGTSEQIGTDAIWPQVAINASGNAMAVWCQYDGTRDNIWANMYR